MGAGSGTDGQKAVDIQHQGLGGGDGYHADVQNGTGRCGVGFRKEAAGFDFGHDIPVPPPQILLDDKDRAGKDQPHGSGAVSSAEDIFIVIEGPYLCVYAVQDGKNFAFVHTGEEGAVF